MLRLLCGQGRRSVCLALIGAVAYSLLAGARLGRAAALNPRLALISVGANGLDNPAPAVLALLSGRDVLWTDQHGAIRVETDGAQMWVEVVR